MTSTDTRRQKRLDTRFEEVPLLPPIVAATTAIDTACSRPDYDPEWWVHEHTGRCSTTCAHGLAVHICRTHCDLYEPCLKMASKHPEQWNGMVVGGILWNVKGPTNTQPMPRIRCSACPFREKVFHETDTQLFS